MEKLNREPALKEPVVSEEPFVVGVELTPQEWRKRLKSLVEKLEG